MITLGISHYGNGLHDICELIRDIIKEKEAMSHQNRRTPLPKDYQFGDAGKEPEFCLMHTPPCVRVKGQWRPHHENAAEQLARRGEYNVIEGEHE